MMKRRGKHEGEDKLEEESGKDEEMRQKERDASLGEERKGEEKRR